MRAIHSSLQFATIILISALAMSASGCSSNSTAEANLPNGVRCRSESSGWFLFRTTSIACVDSGGKVIGSYSDH